MRLLKTNPNRMELLKLKRRLGVAVRGYELLKEKRDNLTQKFLSIVKKSFLLREEVEKKLERIFTLVSLERVISGDNSFEDSVMFPGAVFEMENKFENIMGVKIPNYSFEIKGEIFSYGFLNSSSFLDQAIKNLKEVLPSLVELAKLEKSVILLANEIKKTIRRVNALEYILIPELKQTIKFILAKLDQLERSNFVKLLKIKLS